MNLRRITLACVSLPLLGPLNAAPSWDCTQKSDGDWDCQAVDLGPPPEPVEARISPLSEPALFAPEPLPPPELSEEPASAFIEPAIEPEPAPTATFSEPAPAAVLAEPEPATEPAPFISEPLPPVAAPEPAAIEQPEPKRANVAPPSPEPTEPVGAPTPAAASGFNTDPGLIDAGQQPEIYRTALAEAPEPVGTELIGGSELAPSPVAAETTAATDSVGAISPLALEQIPWTRCGPDLEAASIRVDDAARQSAPMHLSADQVESEAENKVRLSGSVRGNRADQNMAADKALYHRDSEHLDLDGNVQYRDALIVIDGTTASMDLANDRGEIEQVAYRLLDINARGEAATATIDGRDRSHYTDISYTTCRPGNTDWQLRADRLSVDRASGVAVARDASLRFKGIPVAWTPYLSFPTDDRRKSGVLLPSFGHSDKRGFDVAVPYYLNLAPNYDATVTPRLMSNRGAMLGAEFRYLQPNLSGIIAGELLPNDTEDDRNNRGQIHWEHQQRFGKRLRLNIDVANVSDDDYLQDFGDSLSLSSTRHLLRRADLRYFGDGWSLLARADSYQTLSDPFAILNEPYSRLPQVLLDLPERDLPGGLTVAGFAEYVQFDASDRVDGGRLDVRPEIALPVKRSWGYVRPAVSGRYTRYDLNDQTIGLDDAPSRTLFTASLDSGLYFDRDTQFGGHSVTQTLEPRLYYLYTPFKDQTDIPVFDTAEFDLAFPTLFADNRFSSADRVSDANQVTLALTSRLINSSGGNEWLRASIGQTFFFADRRVGLPGATAIDTSSSNIIGELKARLTESWSLRSAAQWDPHDSELDRGAIAVQYRGANRTLLNLSYRYRRDVLDQADLSARLPLGNAWTLLGRMNYALDDSVVLESFAGIEYGSCCWRTRLLARHYLTDNGLDHNTAIMLQLELKGLASLGDRIDRFLERGIYGYEVDD